MRSMTKQQPSEEKAKEVRDNQRAALETMIQARLKAALDARRSSGIEQIWQEDQDQYDGFDELNPPDGKSPVGSASLSTKGQAATTRGQGRSRAYLNITKPKTDTAISRVQEMLLPTDDRPWALEPPQIPEIDEAIATKDQSPVPLGDGNVAPREAVAQTIVAKARERCDRMSKVIEDWLTEGRVYSEMRKVLRDAGRIGTGVLKGPVPIAREDRKWIVRDGMTAIQMVPRLAPTSRAVSPWNLYPDPACGDNIHNGAFLFERDDITARQIRAMAKLPDYDNDAIVQVLEEGPLGPAQFEDRRQRSRVGKPSTYDSETFEVYYYWGDIPTETLISGGFVVTGFLDAEEPADRAEQIKSAMQMVTVPVLVTTINGRIVRVSMNPLETGEFPFDVFPWEPMDGQVWGRGVPRKMAVPQRMLNAAVRALLENAGLSAGPQIVAMRGAIEADNNVNEITGRKLWWFDPDNDTTKDVRQAFQVFTVTSAQEELQAIVQFALDMADQVANLPLLMQGAMGQAPDTVGGMAMLHANATSPLKAIAKTADDFIFVPHMTRYYSWGMQDPAVDPSAKGDARVKARGATALVQRDFLAQFLPQLLPFVKDPAFKLDPEKYIGELLRANRFSPEQVSLSPEKAKQIEEQMANQPPDPRIAAAQINAQVKQAQGEMSLQAKREELEFKRQDHAEQRELDKLIADVEFQIQAMEFAGQKEITFDQLKTMLATKAMDIRAKKELFAAERQFAVSEGEGRGL